MKVSIIIPIFNEIKILEDSLVSLRKVITSFDSGLFEVILADSGSIDGSNELAASFASANEWHYTQSTLQKPSVGRTVSQGIAASKGDYLLVLPVDCKISEPALNELLDTIYNGRPSYGGFLKSYDSTSLLMQTYLWLQNMVRTKLLKNIVWTNGIWFKYSCLQSCPVPLDGFLEDVVLSDRLKKEFRPLILNSTIKASTRRYLKNSEWKRIYLNGLILASYRLGFRNLDRLKRMYLGTT